MPKKQSKNPRRRYKKNTKTLKFKNTPYTDRVISDVVLASPALKASGHLQEEVLPIPLSSLINPQNVGTDADYIATRYTLIITIPTGNSVNTVTANISHSGPWVRRGTSTQDTFYQKSMEKSFTNNKRVVFNVNLTPSEREYINPGSSTDVNYINIRIRDICGILPGVIFKLQAIFHLYRAKSPALLATASSQATDRYQDQAVTSGSIVPPAVNDVPQSVQILGGNGLPLTNNVSPYIYSDGVNTYHVTAGSPVNITGVFLAFPNDNPTALQANYVREGYEGTITKIK